jgi:hypothetical protein
MQMLDWTQYDNKFFVDEGGERKLSFEFTDDLLKMMPAKVVCTLS